MRVIEVCLNLMSCPSNAPAVFQELMSVVLNGCHAFAIAYLDDILIFSTSFEEHLIHLNTIFDRQRHHGLKLKLKKCSFLQTETNYLGFVIDENGIKPDHMKVEAIRALPAPTCVKEVRSFVGMFLLPQVYPKLLTDCRAYN